ncbi:MAG: (Fe-S)-binding protein [Nanoarchaeota archaeon]|nr:(Fe-S)-binding protein [Nanoarchaeota archaeon]
MSFIDKLTRKNILYYPGCLTKFAAKEIGEKYQKVFRKLGIDFIMLPNVELCCGSPVISGGHADVAKEIAVKNFQIFKDHGVKKIITNCPGCFKVFSKNYPLLVPEWDIEVEHATVTLLKEFEKNKPKVTKKITATYHDPCHLAKHCGITEEPRKLLALLGVELKEMPLSKMDAFCCGGGSSVKSNYPELAKSVAKERLEMAKEAANIVITPCPMCFKHMDENAEGINVLELSELLDVEENGKD